MTNQRTLGLLLLIAAAAPPTLAQHSSPGSVLGPGATVADLRTGTMEELRVEAEAYGGNWQWTVIGPTEFAEIGDSPIGAALGVGLTNYVFPLGPGSQWMAQLELPQGATVVAVCPMLYDNHATGWWSAELLAGEAAETGGTPTYHVLGAVNTLPAADMPGYTIPCMFPGFTFRSLADLNVDGFANPVAYQIFLFAGAGITGMDMMHAGALVVWHRDVSPAPGFATFGDVPTGHSLHRFVEALSASGITAGCGSGNFCPNAPLTRGQMAVFLARALGLHWDS